MIGLVKRLDSGIKFVYITATPRIKKESGFQKRKEKRKKEELAAYDVDFYGVDFHYNLISDII